MIMIISRTCKDGFTHSNLSYHTAVSNVQVDFALMVTTPAVMMMMSLLMTTKVVITLKMMIMMIIEL